MQKIWQYATIAFIACGFSSIQALSLETSLTHIPTVKSIDRQSIALNKVICAVLTFSNGPIVHKGKLRLNENGTGMMTVKFYSTQQSRSESVDQIMRMENSPYGIVIIGTDPVYSGTITRHPSYSPDNFLLKIDENGEYTFFTFDLQRNISAVDVSAC